MIANLPVRRFGQAYSAQTTALLLRLALGLLRLRPCGVGESACAVAGGLCPIPGSFGELRCAFARHLGQPGGAAARSISELRSPFARDLCQLGGSSPRGLGQLGSALTRDLG